MQCTPPASKWLVSVCLFQASTPWFFSLGTPAIFLSIVTGSLKLEHYTRGCEFGNFHKIKKQKQHKKNTQKLLAEFLLK